MSGAPLDGLERLLRAMNNTTGSAAFVYRAHAKGAAAWLTAEPHDDSPRIGEAVTVDVPPGASHGDKLDALDREMRRRIERHMQRMAAAVGEPGRAPVDVASLRGRDEELVRRWVASLLARSGGTPAAARSARSGEEWLSIAGHLRRSRPRAVLADGADAGHEAERAAVAAEAMARGDVPGAVGALAASGDVEAWRRAAEEGT